MRCSPSSKQIFTCPLYVSTYRLSAYSALTVVCTPGTQCTFLRDGYSTSRRPALRVCHDRTSNTARKGRSPRTSTIASFRNAKWAATLRREHRHVRALLGFSHHERLKCFLDSGDTKENPDGYLAELASCQPEYTYLAKITGKAEYYERVSPQSIHHCARAFVDF